MTEVVRLVPSDLDELDKLEERPSTLKRLRDHHHLIARLVAEGKRTTDIAQEVGLSISRVSILKNDPAFRELVEKYRMNIEQLRDIAFSDNTKKMVTTYGILLDELHDRIDDQPETFSHEQILRSLEFLGDRIGYPKSTKSVSVNTNLSFDGSYLAVRDDAGRRLAAQQSAPKLINGAAVAGPVITSKPVPPTSDGENGGGHA